jgi:hypothetical protein
MDSNGDCVFGNRLTKEQILADPNFNPYWKELATKHPHWEVSDIDYVVNVHEMTSYKAAEEVEQLIIKEKG